MYAENRVNCVMLLLSFLGTFSFTIILSFIRFYCYIYQEIEPNMSPVFIVLFSPILGFLFGFVGVIVEFILSKLLIPPKTNSKAFLYGACYSLPLLYLIDW